MKFSVRFALLAGLVVGLAGMPAFAQGQSSTQSQTSQKAQTGQQSGQAQSGQKTQQGAQAAAAPKKKMDPAEEKAYEKFYKASQTDPQTVIKLGEDFVKKYPTGPYDSTVWARMATAYEATGQTEKMFNAGQKALALNPNNVDVLSLMAYAIPRRVDPNSLGAADRLQKAETYGKRALALLAKMTKPKNLTDEQFTRSQHGEEALCHSGLGLVYYYQHNIPSMISELEQAVKLSPMPDPTDQYLLGFAYAQAGRYSDALAPLQACSSSVTPMTSRCKSLLSEVKKHVKAQPKPKSQP